MTINVILGDCREKLLEMQPSSVDCVIVDPPYGETSLRWDKRVPSWPTLVQRVLKPTGSMWVFGSMRMFLETADEFRGWRLAQDVVWEKHNGAGFFADRFRRVHENALQFYLEESRWGDVYKEPQFTNDAMPRTVRRKGRPAHWTGERGESVYRSEDGGPRLVRSVIYARSEHGRAIHPTQKPVELVEALLRYSCPVGGVVLDPMAGSGTVGLAAMRNDRSATLIEADPDYFGAILDRLKDDSPLLPQGRLVVA